MKDSRSGDMERQAQEHRGRGVREIPDPETVQRVVCAEFCAHFKGAGGEAECGGFSAVSRAAASGKISAGQMEMIRSRRPFRPERFPVLSDKLCSTCGYRKHDCDFQSPEPPQNATPCGGYRVLRILLEIGQIREDEI